MVKKMKVALLLTSSLTFITALLATPQALALSDDSCRDRHGLAINSRECIDFRKQSKPLIDIDCFNSPDCRREKEAAAGVRREREEQTKQAEQEAIEKQEADAARRSATAVAAGKAKCGDDYKSPKIGMSIDRVRACVTQVKLKGQLNRADGVVSTFEGGNAYFHVMEGRIISWGKY